MVVEVEVKGELCVFDKMEGIVWVCGVFGLGMVLLIVYDGLFYVMG